MSPQQRSAAAKKAAAARWSADVAEAVCGSADQPLKIGDVELECYVLSDGRRVLTQAAFLTALGRHRKAKKPSDSGLPPMLDGKALEPFISDDVREKSRPITFLPPTGGRFRGYEAELLPAVCEIYLKAREAGVLRANQMNVAQQAEVLVRALAHVGIIALVDEATGYQEMRSRDALARILEVFIAQELQPWLKTFPPDFYKEMFRLRGVDPKEGQQRPGYFGKLTNNVVYDRLAPGVLEELQKVNPKGPTGRRRHLHHQHLTPNAGYPKLREHLGSVTTLMKVSTDWNDFIRKLDQIHPKWNATLPLPLDM